MGGSYSIKRKKFRIDKGATISDSQQELILQANKDAENVQVKKSDQKDSHRILAKCVIDPNKVDAEKAKVDLEESFKANN
jgi:HJR/Mrr/RecB family endonuclease